jgi:hypothetical protein
VFSSGQGQITQFSELLSKKKKKKKKQKQKTNKQKKQHISPSS